MPKNKFKELYDYCQTLTPKVGRNQIIGKIKDISNVPRLRVMKSTLDTSVIRGYFLSASNIENPIVKQHGTDVIVLARGLNDCWERFVNIKEAMHLLDSLEDKTDSIEKFEKLLIELEAPSGDLSRQTISDYKGIWMALACLCPEKNRLDFESLRAKGQIDNYGIALHLKIPEQYVPLLFRPEYRVFVDSLIG